MPFCSSPVTKSDSRSASRSQHSSVSPSPSGVDDDDSIDGAFICFPPTSIDRSIDLVAFGMVIVIIVVALWLNQCDTLYYNSVSEACDSDSTHIAIITLKLSLKRVLVMITILQSSPHRDPRFTLWSAENHSTDDSSSIINTMPGSHHHQTIIAFHSISYK